MKSVWMLVVMGLAGAGCRSVPPKDRHGRPEGLLAAPARGVAVGLERFVAPDDRRRLRGPGPWEDPHPLAPWAPRTGVRGVGAAGPGRLDGASPRPSEALPVPAGPAASDGADDPGEAPLPPTFRWPEERPQEPVRDAPERYVERYFELVVAAERLQKSLGYRDFVPKGSQLSFLDTENPVLAREREALQQRLERHGNSLFMRPAEKSLRELDFYRDARMGIEDLKTNVLRRGMKDGGSYGTLSGRLRGGGPKEMVELCYRWSGWRVGSTMGTLRISCRRRIIGALKVEMSSRYHYASEETSANAMLQYDFSPSTSAFMLMGTEFGPALLPTLQARSDTGEKASRGGGLYMLFRF